MTYDHIQYGNDAGEELVSSCCGAAPHIETEYGGLVTSAVECSACRYACTLVPNRGIDSDSVYPLQ